MLTKILQLFYWVKGLSCPSESSILRYFHFLLMDSYVTHSKKSLYMIKKIVSLFYWVKGLTGPSAIGVLRYFHFLLRDNYIARAKRFLCVTAENYGDNPSENYDGMSENSSPENEPEEENNNNLSNSDSKNIFEDEKNVKRALEIKNRDASKRTKDDMLFVVKYHEWLGKDVWENNWNCYSHMYRGKGISRFGAGTTEDERETPKYFFYHVRWFTLDAIVLSFIFYAIVSLINSAWHFFQEDTVVVIGIVIAIRIAYGSRRKYNLREDYPLLYNDEIAEYIRENIYLEQAGMRTTWRTKRKDFKYVVSDKQRLKKKIKEIKEKLKKFWSGEGK